MIAHFLLLPTPAELRRALRTMQGAVYDAAGELNGGMYARERFALADRMDAVGYAALPLLDGVPGALEGV